jgi:hypothetical protein
MWMHFFNQPITPAVVCFVTRRTARSAFARKPAGFPRAQSLRKRECVEPRMNVLASKFGIDAPKKLPGEGFKRPWPAIIKMGEGVKAKVEKLFGKEI